MYVGARVGLVWHEQYEAAVPAVPAPFAATAEVAEGGLFLDEAPPEAPYAPSPGLNDRPSSLPDNW